MTWSTTICTEAEKQRSLTLFPARSFSLSAKGDTR
jgi:hypothetical protein